MHLFYCRTFQSKRILHAMQVSTTIIFEIDMADLNKNNQPKDKTCI